MEVLRDIILANYNGSRIMKYLFYLLLFAMCSLFLIGVPVIAAENASSTINITVQVGIKTIVVIDPDSLTWTGGEAVEPGSEGIVKAIQIENMGSTNISKLWANTSYEKSSPFGIGNASKYDAGNFIAISKTNGSSDYFFFVNRVDYNETHQNIYLILPAGTSGFGRFRDGGNEYFWAVTPNTNCTDGNFSIGKVPHTENQSGTVDLTNCDNTLVNPTGGQSCRSGSLSAITSGAYAGNWGWADLYVGPNSDYNNYSVAVNADCNITMFYHWNMDAPGATDGSNTHAEYLSESALYPGGAVIMYVKVKVPYGTAAGNVGKGFLTITAQSV